MRLYFMDTRLRHSGMTKRENALHELKKMGRKSYGIKHNAFP